MSRERFRSGPSFPYSHANPRRPGDPGFTKPSWRVLDKYIFPPALRRQLHFFLAEGNCAGAKKLAESEGLQPERLSFFVSDFVSTQIRMQKGREGMQAAIILERMASIAADFGLKREREEAVVELCGVLVRSWKLKEMDKMDRAGAVMRLTQIAEDFPSGERREEAVVGVCKLLILSGDPVGASRLAGKELPAVRLRAFLKECLVSTAWIDGLPEAEKREKAARPSRCPPF
jgi:hypothetical protein